MANRYNVIRNNWADFGTVSRSGRPKEPYNPFADKHFNPDKLDTNEIKSGDATLAKIPAIADRVFVQEREGGADPSVMFVADRYPDGETGEIHDDMVEIGTDISRLLKGMMMINERYHEYFDRNGRIVNDPLARRREKEAAEKAERERKKAAEKQKTVKTERKPEKCDSEDGTSVTCDSESGTSVTRGEERTVDEIKAALLEKEKELEQKIQEYNDKVLELDERIRQAQMVKEELEKVRDVRKYQVNEEKKGYFEMLDGILHDYQTSVNAIARKKPNLLMSATQIQTINEALGEIKYIFHLTTAGDFLHLAAEPREDDLEHFPGTTYGEMSLILASYERAFEAYRLGKLYYKQEAEEKEEEENQ